MFRRALIVLTTVALASLGLSASADTGAITDKKGDATGCSTGTTSDCDIVKAAWGHRSHHRLMHQVTVDGTAGGFAGDRPQVLPRLYINVPGQKFDNPNCDFFVDPLPPGAGPNKSDHYKYYVQTCQNTGAQVRGEASPTRVNAHTIRLVFKKRLIGSPSQYGWQFAYPADGDNPAYDEAPNGYKTHHLG
jgi:hypothetical protein